MSCLDCGVDDGSALKGRPLLMVNMILLQTDELISKALEVTPANGIAYGVLVALLCSIAVFLWRELSKEREYSKAVAEKIITLTTKVGADLDSDKVFKDTLKVDVQELKHTINMLDQLVRGHYGNKL